MHYFVIEMCTFMVQNGALWGMGLVHCGICATGLLEPIRWQAKALTSTFPRSISQVTFLDNTKILATPFISLWGTTLGQNGGNISDIFFGRQTSRLHLYVIHTWKVSLDFFVYFSHDTIQNNQKIIIISFFGYENMPKLWSLTKNIMIPPISPRVYKG